jgi:thiazole synthase
MQLRNRPLVIAGREFQSRLLVGTGKFSSPEAMRDALAATGTELVTVALRRADLSGKRIRLPTSSNSSTPSAISCCPTPAAP